MKKEREKKLDAKLKKAIEEKLDGIYIKLSAQHLSGIPDRLCLLPDGEMFFAEIKTTGEKPRKLQLSIHKRLQKKGFKVEVIDSSEKIESLIQEFKKSV